MTEAGTVYKTKVAWPAIDVERGEIGISIEDYNSGASILFERGGNCGFSAEEIDQFLIVCGKVDLDAIRMPRFRSVIILEEDFRKGRYADALANARAIAAAAAGERA